MENQEVWVGSLSVGNGGHVVDRTRKVVFEGERLARYEERALDGTRGIREALFRTAEGKIVVHQECWSNWQHEPTSAILREVGEIDLLPGGTFEDLGREAGFWDHLTIEQALALSAGADYD